MDRKQFEEIIYYIWFTMTMGGKRALARDIYKRVGSMEKIYRANRTDYKRYGITNEEVIEILMNKDLSAAEREMWFANNYNVSFLTINSPEYPRQLRESPGAPLMLYVRGSHFNPNEELYIGIIGTRSCSQGGKEMAYRLARELAYEGITVVGGMSPGIEVAAHEGCLAGGGKTTAVLISGVNQAYPKGTTDLMLRTMNSGAVISEYPFDCRSFPGNFTERNRIISALCMGIVVVEAPADSNSLKTARMAFDLNRDLFAVPGDIKNKNAAGPNELLKTAAKPVTRVRDILEEYENVYPELMKTSKFNAKSVEFDIPTATGNASADETAVMDAIREFPKSVEEIAAKTNKSVAQVNGIITMLELKDKIKRTPQNTYAVK